MDRDGYTSPSNSLVKIEEKLTREKEEEEDISQWTVDVL